MEDMKGHGEHRSILVDHRRSGQRSGDMGIVLVAILAGLVGPGPLLAAEILSPDGPSTFSSVRITESEDPHAYGLIVQLCKDGDEWRGFISEYLGPVADPAAAGLENLLLDERSGAISFTARLTVGVEPWQGSTVPAKRLYEFTGNINQDAMVGVLAKQPIPPSRAGPTSEDLVLKRQAADTASAMPCTRRKNKG